jgi:hypothetical protein
MTQPRLMHSRPTVCISDLLSRWPPEQLEGGEGCTYGSTATYWATNPELCGRNSWKYQSRLLGILRTSDNLKWFKTWRIAAVLDADSSQPVTRAMHVCGAGQTLGKSALHCKQRSQVSSLAALEKVMLKTVLQPGSCMSEQKTGIELGGSRAMLLQYGCVDE